MMLIPVITKNSGLVPLIEGLYAQILLRIEIIGGLRSHLCFSFLEEKVSQRKKQLVQDLVPPPSTYIHMCTLSRSTHI